MAKVKYANTSDYNRLKLWLYPNAGPNPSVSGMRKIYGDNAAIIRHGNYIYNVPWDVYNRI